MIARLILLLVLAVPCAASASPLAKDLFGAQRTGSQQKPQAIGDYARGCGAGMVQLPESGPTWQAMRLSRGRNWGQPELVRFLIDLSSAARQMGWAMIRTSRSPIFNQSHDFSCFITDAAGTLVSQADGIPIHTGGGGFAVRALLRVFSGNIAPGDAFILGVADNVMAESKLERLEAISAMVERYGACPIRDWQ